MLRKQLLCSTIALASVLLATTAHADSVVWGGGSTASEPYYLLVFGLLNAQSPTASFGTTGSTLNPVDPTNSLLGYAGIGSGAGRTQFETNTPAASSTTGYLETSGDDIAYAVSDSFISSTDLTAYQPLAATNGPLVQIPMSGVPITIAYSFNPQLKAGVKSPFPSQLVITDADLCKLWSDKNANWEDVASVKAIVQKYPNDFVSTGAFKNLTLVTRSDSAAATFLLTQHLQHQCFLSGISSNFNSAHFTGPVSKWSTSGSSDLFISGTEPSFDSQPLSSGTATEVVRLKGLGVDAVTYVSPDYTVMAPNSANNKSGGYNLPVAALVNYVNGKSYLPNTVNTTGALGSPGTGAAHLGAPTSYAAASNQLNWGPSIPMPSAGYPIVGYSVILLAQCYADNNVAKELKTLLTGEFNGSYATQLATSGFVAVPANFAFEIQKTFIANGNKYSPSLAIQDATLCKSATGAAKTAKYVGR